MATLADARRCLRNHASVVVELEGQRFDRLVVSCDDPEAVAAAISRR